MSVTDSARSLNVNEAETYNLRSQVRGPYPADVDAIDDDPPTRGIDKSQQTHGQCRLSTSRTSEESNSLLCLEIERYIVEHGREFWDVTDAKVLHDKQVIFVRARLPISRWSAGFDDGRGLLGEVEILRNSFHRVKVQPKLDQATAGPVHRCTERHGRRDTYTSSTSGDVAGKGE